MRKTTFITGIVIALAAIYPIASHYHGKQIKERLDTQVQQLNQKLAEFGLKDVSITADQGESGIFSSQYIFGLKTQNGEHIELLNNAIQHGPFPLDALKKGRFSPSSYTNTITLIRNEKTAPFFKLFQVEQPLLVEYTHGYDKHIKGNAQLAPLSAENKTSTQEDQFSMGKVQLDFKTNHQFSDFSTQWNLDGLQIKSTSQNTPAFQLTMGPVQASTQGSVSAQNQFNYQTTSDIKDIRVEVQNNIITVQEITGTGNVNDDGIMIGLNEKGSYKNILLNGNPIGEIDIDMGYQRLDSAATKQFLSIAGTILSDLIKQDLNKPADTKVDVEAILAPHLPTLKSVGKDIFKHSPVLQYGPITHRNQGGAFSIKADMGFRFPDLAQVQSQDELVLQSFAKTDFSLKSNQDWLSTLLVDVMSFAAKDKGLPAPSTEEKQIMQKLSADIQQALLQSELANADQQNVSFTLSATAPEGKSLKDIETIRYNGQDYPVMALVGLLDGRFKQFIQQMALSESQIKATEIFSKYMD
ncbi:YdgA family protein [Pelistega suis]|uniref:YdgA family protein n=1 Tax=Pelistega suis TaxID=1631957 RepID=UPI00211B7467|nr:YdgA family protein [Pelistega suis]MCQ9329440.1 YdgA family protein [Pelistega suis]